MGKLVPTFIPKITNLRTSLKNVSNAEPNAAPTRSKQLAALRAGAAIEQPQ